MSKRISFPANVVEPVRQYLLSKEKKLEKRKQELAKEDPFTDPGRLNDNAASDTDAAEQFGHARVAAMKEEIDKTLINIRKALTRIKIGKYGLCESCGKMIDTDRLAIDPAAQFCVECKKKGKAKSN
jgi:RNA polymerase-binding transcription factor DksA